MTNSDEGRICLVIEIQKCTSLLSEDLNGFSDPYVKIKLLGNNNNNNNNTNKKKKVGSVVLHQTKHKRKTLNPVFTEKENNRYLLDISVKELLDDHCGIVQFKLKDWDAIGFDDDLGTVDMSIETLSAITTAETFELKVTPPPKRSQDDAGYLFIRCHPADDFEKQSLSSSYSSRRGKKKNSSTSPVPSSSSMLLDSLTRRKSKPEKVEYDPADLPATERHLFIQVKSCRDLKATDPTCLPDPYVKIKLGGSSNSGSGGRKDLHKTNPRIQTVNPNYNVVTDDAAFVLDLSPKQVFENGGLEFKIKDASDRGGSLLQQQVVGVVSANDDLGSVHLPAKKLYTSIDLWEEEFKIVSPTNKKGQKEEDKEEEDVGYITILVREATNLDKDSLRNDNDKKTATAFLSRVGIETPRDATRGLSSASADTIGLLIEVVSCWGLIKPDMGAFDPYVKVKLGKMDIHTTKRGALDQTLRPLSYVTSHVVTLAKCDPIYTIKSDSMFIFDVAEQDFAVSSGLHFKVKDIDVVGRSNSDEVGSVTIEPKLLLEAVGERMVFKLDPPVGQAGKDAGNIAIRCRRATKYDREFLENVKNNTIGSYLGIDETYEAVMKSISSSGGVANTMKSISTGGVPSIMQKSSMVDKTGPDAGKKKYRVRPISDPERMAVTEWMTKDGIHAEALTTSRKWVDIGTGEHCKVYVEVIGADGLPSRDKKLPGGTLQFSSRDTNLSGMFKPNAFVALIYEDCLVKTDAIDDCLSPRWLPWMQRAFVLNMAHPSSHLFLGAFDSDPTAMTVTDQHNMLGRVAIDLRKLRPNTEYLLCYSLYENSFALDRQTCGTITVRLRLDFSNQRRLVLSNIAMPPDTYINVKKKRDWLMMRQILYGKQDVTSFSMKTLDLYVKELASYSRLLHYFLNGAETLLFWRGQVHIVGELWIPLHSLGLFMASIILVENPWYGPSFLFIGVGWFLLACQHWRNTSPNPWDKTKPFIDFAMMLAFGSTFLRGPASIVENENYKESKKYEDEYLAGIKAAEDSAAQRQENLKLLKEQREAAGFGGLGSGCGGALQKVVDDDDIATKTGGISVNPLKPILYPLQRVLGVVCNGLRFARNIGTWDEAYLSFILASGSIALGLVLLLVPWSFLVKWLSRIFVWGVFGPHMKLVDIFYYSKFQQMGLDEKKKLAADTFASQCEKAEKLAMIARVKKEDATKLRDMKHALYGSYMVKIPTFSLERFPDVPLHSSVATPIVKKKKPAADDDSIPLTSFPTTRVAGQELVGTMIPTIKKVESSVEDNIKAKKFD